MVNAVAVIGLGNISRRHRSNLRKIFPEAKIFAVSSRGTAPDYPVEDADVVFADVASLLDYNVDFAIIASPSSYHLLHSEVLLANNIPLLIEKPVTATAQDSKVLQKNSVKYNSKVAVAYCLRYLPSAQVVRKLLAERSLGKLYNIFSAVGQYLPSWRSTDYKRSVTANKDLGGGVLLELSHEFDYLQWMIGDVELLHCSLRNTRELMLEVEEIADAVLKSSTGCVCNVHLNLLEKLPRRQCVIIAENGRLEWDLIKNTVVLYDADLGVPTVLYDDSAYVHNEMYLDMIKDFVCLLQGRENSCVTLDEAVRTVHLIESMKRCSYPWRV